MHLAARFHDLVAAMPMWALYAVSVAEFAAIYLGFGWIATRLSTQVLPARGVGHVIDARPLKEGQVQREIRNSLVSIAIFGVYGLVTIWLDSKDILKIDWSFNLAKLPLDLVILTVWNEVHFYACHRALHTRWLYKHVHLEHHRSVVPTPYATYSFHWFEAVLLGSVMLFGMTFWTFGILTVILFPLVSLAMNNLGHWNYEVLENHWLHRLFDASRRHSGHHQKVTGNFGFMLPQLDRWLGTRLP